MITKITDDDIKWYEDSVKRQTNLDYKKIVGMELKLANAIKELQEK